MANRKITRKYHFSVEGETEQWYIHWLERQINSDPAAIRRVSFDCNKKDPLKNAKELTVTHPTIVTHIFDYESSDPVHTTRFASTLERMKKAGYLGKNVKDAIHRAHIITARNHELGYPLRNYKGYCYYSENPSLSIWETISMILSDCCLINR